jgi:hypothetical protein
MKTKTIKRYLISTGITFLVAFSISMIALWESLTWETVQNGAWASIIFSAIRSGLKAVFEAIIAWSQKKKAKKKKK